MPSWKTFDEETAKTLKDHLGNVAPTAAAIGEPVFGDHNAVVIAPTAQAGAALVIVARKTTPVLAQPPVEVTEPDIEPAVEVPWAPDRPTLLPTDVPEPASFEEFDSTASVDEPALDSDFTFGPTTWERADQFESVPDIPDSHFEDSSSNPEVWDLPSESPTHEAPRAIAQSDNHWATGFLGLDDLAGDEKDTAPAKRTWWKKLFTNEADER